MSSRILIVDDDKSLAEMVGIVLRNEGFEALYAPSGDTALKIFESQKPDLVLLDLMLPGVDGIEVCREIRKTSGVPIIMLTAKGDATDVVNGLETGADDYVVKPFNPKELIARIRARLRPIAAEEVTELRIGDLYIDTVGHEVKRGDEQIMLTPLEFQLLVTLARKPKQVYSREALLEEVWGYRYKADTRLVNVHVQRLRAKVELDPDNPKVIATVRGIGYRAGALF
ncbi:MAG: response regulator transcription factor [Microbacteriaceae bacterium]|nr:response regulator transcription factor [Microbacteriaceae bacterium]